MVLVFYYLLSLPALQSDRVNCNFCLRSDEREVCRIIIHRKTRILVSFLVFELVIKGTLYWVFTQSLFKKSLFIHPIIRRLTARLLGLGRYSQYQYTIDTEDNRYVSIRSSCCTDTSGSIISHLTFI